MDPLSALSLAGTVVQFVQFASSLIGGSRKIYNSACGASDQNENIEEIYQKLYDLSHDLENQIPPDSERFGRDTGPSFLKRGAAIRNLAAKCKDDCDELLEIVYRLKLQRCSGPKWWASFVLAMKEVTKAKAVKELEDRISGYQRQMILELCTASSQALDQINLDVVGLKTTAQHLYTQRSDELLTISATLAEIRDQIKVFQTDPDKTSLSGSEIESLTKQVSELSLTGQQYRKEFSILKDLNYDHRVARHEKIHDAHEVTLQWAFKPSGTKQDLESRISRWLSTGSGVFWVSGKPGSGKSTFMKFMADHQQTIRLLSRWGCSKDVVLASHYFWYAGTAIQRSQEGLLRSLLFDILCQVPDLIPIACKERWTEASNGRGTLTDNTAQWTLAALQQAMSRIANQHNLPVNFCFFIDGLDEFDGDHPEVCQTLMGLCKSTNIKMCVSSRPWNVFEEAFGGDALSKLYIHELTRQDIKKYTEQRLYQHPRWKGLVSETQQASLLVTDITDLAQGVFLWVFLVTRMLREGLTNHDSLSDLRKRLESIPTDLESFFQQMIESVEPFYHQKMAGILKIAVDANEPLPVTVYSFHELEYESELYALKEPIDAWSPEKFEALIKPFPARLNSRCKGLLEINEGKVEFLHRTVHDFLRTRDIETYITIKAREGFDSHLSIFRAYVAWIKHINYMVDEDGSADLSEMNRALLRLIGILDNALRYAQKACCHQDACATVIESTEDLLDDLELTVHTLRSTVQASCSDSEATGLLNREPTVLFRECALKAGLSEYTRRKLDQDGTYCDGFAIPPLVYLLTGNKHKQELPPPEAQQSEDNIATNITTVFPHRVELLQSLLIEGHSPNLQYTDTLTKRPTTPWLHFISTVVPLFALSLDTASTGPRTTQHTTMIPFSGKRITPYDQGQDHLIEVLEEGLIALLLRHGADPNAQTPAATFSRSSLPVWAQFLLLVFTTSQIADHIDVYIYTLEAMLAKADFGTPVASLQDLEVGMTTEMGDSRATQAHGSRSKQAARTSMQKILFLILERLSLDSPTAYWAGRMLRKKTLIVKAISAFLDHAAHPSMPRSVLDAQLRRVLPSSVARPAEHTAYLPMETGALSRYGIKRSREDADLDARKRRRRSNIIRNRNKEVEPERLPPIYLRGLDTTKEPGQMVPAYGASWEMPAPTFQWESNRLPPLPPAIPPHLWQNDSKAGVELSPQRHDRDTSDAWLHSMINPSPYLGFDSPTRSK